MADLTISSPLTPPAFASFTLDVSDAQALDQLRDESATVYGFSVNGSGARAAHVRLAPLETRVLLNGEPSLTLAGTRVAAAIGQGHLVTITLTLYQRGAPLGAETLTVTGIITSLVWAAAAGALGQRVDFVLHRCDRLHVRAGGTVTTQTTTTQPPPNNGSGTPT